MGRIIKEKFCNPDCLLNVEIPELMIKEFFGENNRNEIFTRYNDMRENFDRTYIQWQDNFNTKSKPYNWEKGKRNDNTTAIEIKGSLFDDKIKDFKQIGFDLPTWFNISENKPRIMFIAQDPLRSEYYKDCFIIVSSPFGMHDQKHRKGKIETRLFEELVENCDYGIYITDYHKFYLQHYDETRIRGFQNTQNQKYNDVLTKEIEFVKPNLIVTLGNIAVSYFEQKDKKNILSMTHLSGNNRRRGNIQKYLENKEMGADGKYTNKFIAEQYAQIIKRNL